MNVVFRVDASLHIGSGHVMRCLTLANELRRHGVSVYFISCQLEGHLCDFCESAGFEVRRLPAPLPMHSQNSALFAIHPERTHTTHAEQSWAVLSTMANRPDWLIVDNYAIDARWENRMRPLVKRIMVIDDLADRRHNCDVLLDQNLYENMETRYDGLVPDHCTKMLGPRYALLRPEFFEAKKNLRKRDGKVRRILVFFGGSDEKNETAKALDALKSVNRPDIAVDVVIGAANPHKDKLRLFCEATRNMAFHYNIDTMAQMMAMADLAIGAGGSTMWERCLLGLPAITLEIAANQTETADAVARRGGIRNLGWHENVTALALTEAILLAITNPLSLVAMGEKAMALMECTSFEGGVEMIKSIMEVKHSTP